MSYDDEYTDYENNVVKIVRNKFRKNIPNNSEIFDQIFTYWKEDIEENECAEFIVDELDSLNEECNDFIDEDDDDFKELSF